MLEGLVVVAAVAVLAVTGLVVAFVPWPALLAAGAWTTLAGLALGVPTGFWYHVALRRVLATAGPVPRRWWLRPTDHHGVLDAATRRGVMRWFYAGGLGFVFTVVGLVLSAAGLLLGFVTVTGMRGA
jgi:hypothetical protein